VSSDDADPRVRPRDGPDLAGIRRLQGLPADLPDADVAEGYAQARRAQTGGDFAPHYLHKVVAIACALRRDDDLKVWAVGEAGEARPT
jgi:predicted PolB exonuclease-like 3'-5' exonuclease